jgi:hypothetical protein
MTSNEIDARFLVLSWTSENDIRTMNATKSFDSTSSGGKTHRRKPTRQRRDSRKGRKAVPMLPPNACLLCSRADRGIFVVHDDECPKIAGLRFYPDGRTKT